MRQGLTPALQMASGEVCDSLNQKEAAEPRSCIKSLFLLLSLSSSRQVLFNLDLWVTKSFCSKNPKDESVRSRSKLRLRSREQIPPEIPGKVEPVFLVIPLPL